MTHTAPTRRSLLKAGAWTAPAIVLATAAPAVAVSGASRAITIDPGTSGPVYDGFDFYELRFSGFTVTTGSAVGAGALTMTVTNPNGPVYYLGTPAGWSFISASPAAVTFVRSAASAAGETTAVPDGTYVDDDGFRGTFVVSLTAPDHDAAQVSFPIPARRGDAVMSEQERAQLRERRATS